MVLLPKVSGGGICEEEEEDDDEVDVAEFLETCSSTLLQGLPTEAVVTKEGPVEDEEEEKGHNGSSSSSSMMGFVMMPKPIEGLNEAGPPPFLRKTYEMVDDPKTDPLVSWSSGGSSFVVWDQHEFSKYLLPKYFKHRNFSSFIRQLNTYGFKKVDPDRWEFANEGFQRGKRRLLKNIKRRTRNNKNGRGSKTVPYELNDLEIVRNDQDALRGEVINLRRQEQDLCSAISTIEERIRCAESRQQNMFVFLAKAVNNPAYVEKLMGKRKRSTAELGAGDAMTRKRKLLEISAPETDLVPVGNTDKAFHEVLVTRTEAMPEPSGANQGQSGLRDLLPEKRPEQFSEDCIGQSLYGYEAMLRDLLSQSTAAEEVEEEKIGDDDSTIYLELDNLMEKSFGRGLGLGNDLKEQTVGIGLID